MKYKFIRILCFTLLAAGIAACTPGMKSTTEKRYAFADILDISYTPDTPVSYTHLTLPTNSLV